MIRPAAIATTAVTVLLLAGCGGSGGSDSSSSSPTSPGAAEIVSPDSLRETASEAATPIYWAGEQDETELELSQPEKDRTYVRYLTGSAEAGDKKADFLTIGTYAQPDAVASLRRQAKRSGGTIDHAPGNVFNSNLFHQVVQADLVTDIKRKHPDIDTGAGLDRPVDRFKVTACKGTWIETSL